MKAPATAKRTPATTAQVLGIFAKELEQEMFSEERITALLVVALTNELRQSELMVLDGV